MGLVQAFQVVLDEVGALAGDEEGAVARTVGCDDVIGGPDERQPVVVSQAVQARQLAAMVGVGLAVVEGP
ncbi:MAG TPA: hypothetical protein VII19_07915, partial [Acidimicrobiales bacterium]